VEDSGRLSIDPLVKSEPFALLYDELVEQAHSKMACKHTSRKLQATTGVNRSTRVNSP